MDRGKVENARNREGKPKTKVFISESDDKIEWEDRGDARAKLAMKGIAQSKKWHQSQLPGPWRSDCKKNHQKRFTNKKVSVKNQSIFSGRRKCDGATAVATIFGEHFHEME
jgi:hypothetical protein